MKEGIIKYPYIVISTIVAGVCLMFSGIAYAYKKPFAWVSPIYFAIGILTLALLCLIFLRIRDKAGKYEKKDVVIVLSLSVLFFGLILIATHFYYFKTGWDASYVIGAAEALAKGEEFAGAAYFSIYPNNLLLVGIFSLVIRVNDLFGFFPYYYSLIVFQAFSLVASGVLFFFTTNYLSKKRSVAYLSWLIFMIVGGLSPWVIIPYSDTVGLFFTSIVLYLYAKKKLPFVAGLLLMLGYYVKPGVMILGIAIAIVSLPKVIKSIRKKDKKVILGVALAVLGMVSGIVVYKLTERVSGYEIDKERTFGVTHYLMMGLNEEYNGVINIEDQDFSMNIDTAKERKSENLRVAGERLKGMGVLGLFQHFGRKILTTYNDGTFAWYVEGEFMIEPIWTGHPEVEKIFRDFYYPDGKAYNAFQNISQCLWMGVLAFSIAGGFFSKDERELAIMLTLIGVFAYEMLFEPRARHMLVELPLFIYMAVRGVEGCMRWVASKAKSFMKSWLPLKRSESC